MKLHEVIPKNSILGDPLAVHGLGIIPLLADAKPDIPAIDLLEQAFDAGTFRITEVSEGGSVPFLRADNNGSKPVLILDGEELVGGKQNRIVNTTIIILAGKVLDIPVSCMEAGRWNRHREDFTAGEAVFRARSRAVHKSSVTSSLRREGSYRSDQRAVWDEVSYSLAEMHAPSATSDFRASRAKVAHRIDSFVESIRAVDLQVGAVFISRRGILGLEFLATPELFSRCLRKIVRSFAFEVLLDGNLSDVPQDLASGWWENVQQASLSVYPSPGAGEDLRVEGSNLIGSGLLWNNVLVHFSCFPGGSGLSRESGRPDTRRASAGERRRRTSGVWE
jgi:hypothetical protein